MCLCWFGLCKWQAKWFHLICWWFIKSFATISIVIWCCFCCRHILASKSYHERHLNPNGIELEINGNRKYINIFIWHSRVCVSVYLCSRAREKKSLFFLHLFCYTYIFENGKPLCRTAVDWAMKFYRRIVKYTEEPVNSNIFFSAHCHSYRMNEVEINRKILLHLCLCNYSSIILYVICYITYNMAIEAGVQQINE